MSRWPTVTGLWLAVPAWVYAVLAAIEVRDLGYDPTAPEPGHVAVGDGVPQLMDAAAVSLTLVLLLAVVSLVSGRLHRLTDLVLGAGLALGAAVLWSAEQPGPVAPVLLAVVAVVVAASALLPRRGLLAGPASIAARLLLATALLLTGWILVHELSNLHFQLRSWTVGYWSGLGLVVAMLGVALLLPRLTHPAWRWVLGVPLGLLAAVGVVAGVLGLQEGYLLSGHVETEDGWRLGGPPLFLGAGWLAAAVAMLRGRWSLAVGTAGAALLVLLALLFGIPEIRRGL